MLFFVWSLLDRAGIRLIDKMLCMHILQYLNSELSVNNVQLTTVFLNNKKLNSSVPSIIGCLRFFFIFAFVGLQTVSCTPFSAQDRTEDKTVLPESYSLKDVTSAPQQRWWETFHDQQLDDLIEEALAGNQTILSYWARLGQARAQARKAGSELYPELTGDVDASYSKIRNDDGSGGRTYELEQYSLGVFAGYEVDLWGRVRASVKASDLTALASREDLNAAAITIAAEVTQRWVEIISQQRQYSLLEQQLKANSTYLELIELRFRKSMASALDVMQQRQLVERVKAQMPLVEMQEQILHNELTVLIGRLPYDAPAVKDRNMPVFEDLPTAGIPAQLLENRPDVRAAYHRLESADQKLVVAKADRLPALRLTGSAAYNSGELEKIFDNWLVNITAGLTAPLLDGGRRKAEVEISSYAVDEQLADYRQTVLTAVREVEDALIREVKIREHIQRTQQQLQAARIALEEAGSRYVNGLNDYLPVLTQLISVQNLELGLIERHEDLLTARISLYRAIGGSWTDSL